MKPTLFLALVVVLSASCKPQKPWSPDDNDGGPAAAVTPAAAATPEARVDIGDVEQAIYVNGKISAESRQPNVTVTDVIDRNKYITKSTVTITPPRPESLWAEFVVRASRDFAGTPGVLRARVMVENQVAGTFSMVLGSDLRRKKADVVLKLDLLKTFAGSVPDSFLAKVEGDLYLLQPGTDEKSVDPETATSDSHSRALYATIFRVETANAAAPAAETPAPAPATPPAAETPAAVETPVPAPATPPAAETPAPAPAQ